MTDMSKSRACPQPDVIQKYLRENTEFSGEICNDDRVCYACYKSHLITIKHLNSTVNSTDADLCLLIARIQQVHTFDQAIQYTSNTLAVEVGEALLTQRALLLPTIYEKFCDNVMEIIRTRGIFINHDIQTVVSANWLRSQLSSLLEHHLAYRCSVKRYGTVLYRYGGDLLHALNVSLGSSRVQSANTDDTGTDNDFQNNLTKVCLALNDKLHVCIHKLLRKDAVHPQNIEDIDIDKFISELDPDIWKAICLLTQPLSPKAIKKANIFHVRKMRRFFCVCTMLYITNTQCSFPLHVLLADAIETCGGSNRLTKLLNRFGACASPDTHARYVQYRVDKSKKEGPMSGFPDDAFIVASADNLDYIHSYTRVYCGNQQSSWHGTTIQLVQPQPSKLLDNVSPEPTKETSTQAQVTMYISTENESIRHPQTPASGMIETRL